MMTPSLAAGLALAVAIIGREALRVSTGGERWVRPATVLVAMLALLWVVFALERVLALRAGVA